MIWDDEARGLCVRVYPDGAKSFIFLYHINGRQRFIRSGCSPGLSLKAAQTRAGELRRIVDEGRDPAGNERDRRWITSFEKFYINLDLVKMVAPTNAGCIVHLYA